MGKGVLKKRIFPLAFGMNFLQVGWGKNPDMKDNQGKFQPNSSNFKNEKMSKLPFFNDK